MRFGVVLEQGADNWSAYVPDLPGCIATGKTLDDTRAAIAEAIQFHIEGLQLQGLPVPEPESICELVQVGNPPRTGLIPPRLASRLIHLVVSRSGWLASPQFQRGTILENGSQVVAWWESRRVFYNGVVCVAGIVTLILCFISALIGESTGNEAIGLPDPPILLLFGVIVYGFMANVCYTLGWIIEIQAMRIWGYEQSGQFGQIAFVLGVLFSIGLTLAPGALFMIGWLIYAVLHWR